MAHSIPDAYIDWALRAIAHESGADGRALIADVLEYLPPVAREAGRMAIEEAARIGAIELLDDHARVL